MFSVVAPAYVKQEIETESVAGSHVSEQPQTVDIVAMFLAHRTWEEYLGQNPTLTVFRDSGYSYLDMNCCCDGL